MHELIGHKILVGSRYAHIVRVFDEGTFIHYPAVPKVVDGLPVGDPRGRLREVPVCHKISGHSIVHSSWSRRVDEVERNHAAMVRRESNSYPSLSCPPRYEECERCWHTYRAERAAAMEQGLSAARPQLLDAR